VRVAFELTAGSGRVAVTREPDRGICGAIGFVTPGS